MARVARRAAQGLAKAWGMRESGLVDKAWNGGAMRGGGAESEGKEPRAWAVVAFVAESQKAWSQSSLCCCDAASLARVGGMAGDAYARALGSELANAGLRLAQIGAMSGAVLRRIGLNDPWCHALGLPARAVGGQDGDLGGAWLSGGEVRAALGGVAIWQELIRNEIFEEAWQARAWADGAAAGLARALESRGVDCVLLPDPRGGSLGPDAEVIGAMSRELEAKREAREIAAAAATGSGSLGSRRI